MQLFTTTLKKGSLVSVGFSILQKHKAAKKLRRRGKMKRKYTWLSFLFTGILLRFTKNLLVIKCFSGLDGFTLRLLLKADNFYFFKEWILIQKRAVFFDECYYKKILKGLALR